MDELTLDGKTYISSKQAAKITGYAKDYVGQLCREGRVEARLVGRNWYILESSIREHRFGGDEKNLKAKTEEPIKAVEPSWSAANYEAEQPKELPTFDTRPSVNAFEQEKPSNIVVNAPENTSPVISEMQSAWHDWFSQRNEPEILEETLLEAPEDVDSFVEEESESVHITRDIELPEEERYEEEITPVFFNKEPEPERVIEDVVPIRRAESADVEQIRPEYGIYAPEGRVISERRVKSAKKRRSYTSLKLLLGLVIIVSIVFTLIGTGKFDGYLKQIYTEYKIIQILVGERLINK